MNIQRRALTLLLLTVSALWAAAQMLEPVKWQISHKMTDDTHGQVVMRATMDSGWHLYSQENDPDVGPSPLEIKFTTLKGVKLDGKPQPSARPGKHYDEIFEADLYWWEGSVTLTQKFTVTAQQWALDGYVKYSSCNDENCMPPTKEQFEFSGTSKLKAEAEPETAPDAAPDGAAAPDTIAALTAAPTDSLAADGPHAAIDTWAPVTFSDDTNPAVMSSSSLWYIFALCFGGGILALLTPCVWPMIPMTVSFFLKRGNSRGKAIGDAVTYGLSIIVIYVLLGIVITAIFGPSALNELATSATCNIIFFLLLVVFAISFFGAFEIKLPDKWGNKMDSKAEKTTGLISIFFMAFTLALVSFSCTGPIIGTLLVEAATSGDKFGPAVGMFAFALALAIPFCLFAMFPSWLNSAPKSGGWMNTVKVVLGFAELALSLKFLSVADLAYGWHILDRETFLALWIVLFGLCGMYLLGQFNFSHFGPADRSVGVFRFFLGMISLAFTVYLIPGLWGAPLKSVSAFVPPLFTQDFNLYGHEFEEYSDYDEALAVAAREGKPVFVDFSGYGCVNCRKMEGAVLDNPEVHAMIADNFVVVTLMTDDRAPLPEPVTVEERGKKLLLETYGEKWSYLQRTKFSANAQPYYVILDPKGILMSGPFTYDENIPRFSRFLEEGISNYKKHK